MTAHPVLALRSAGSGSPIVCSGRTTHRGHPLWRLVHRLRPTQLHRTIQLPALSLGSVTSVARRATILASVPRTSTRSRMLHHMPEATTTTTVAGLPRKSTPPSLHLPPLVDVRTKLPLKRLMTLLTSFLVRSQSIMFLILFYSIQEHLIHSCQKVMHFVITYLLLNCPPQ